MFQEKRIGLKKKMDMNDPVTFQALPPALILFQERCGQ